MIRTVLTSCFCLFLLAGLVAQGDYTSRKTAEGKLKKWYEKAVTYLNENQLEKARNWLDKILEEDDRFIDAYIQRAAVLYDQKAFEQAEADFEAALALDGGYRDLLWYQLALSEMQGQKFSEAVGHLETYLSLKSGNDRQRALAETYLATCRLSAQAYERPVPFEPIVLPPSINTDRQEYLPSLTADGETLVFTRVVNRQEDFYLSRKKGGVWQEAQPLESINTELNEGAQSISADGKFLVFTICDRPGGLGRCDLYFSEKKNGRWSSIQNLGAPVNSGAWESQPSISADGRTLYFVSDRKGGFGGKDLWVSQRQADGHWAQPTNLGDRLNTPSDDKAPFIHADGQTLYFMSNGHPSLGGFDLFLSRKESGGEWGEPLNLGYPINTERDEGLLIVSLDGHTAYYASDRGKAVEQELGIPNYDLYSFELYPEARPQKVTYVKAFVYEDGSRKPLNASVEILRLADKQLLTAAETTNDGQFLSVLPAGHNYAFNVSKPGYLFHSEHFALQDSHSLDRPYLLEIGLIPVPLASETKPVILRNVFFETGSALLLPESTAELDRLWALLEENADMHIRINGHTDDVGSTEDNELLSERRARSVFNYLASKGIAPSRLNYKGFGESRPIDTNDTPEGRQHNRRTEFVVVERS